MSGPFRIEVSNETDGSASGRRLLGCSGLHPRTQSPKLIGFTIVEANLVEYPAVTWADVHNRYQSEIRVEDDQLGAPSGFVYPVRASDKSKRDIDCEPRSNRDRYQPYNEDRRGNGPWRNTVKGERRSDRSHNNRGLMSKSGFDKPIGSKETPRLSEYNFNVDAAAIVSTIRRIKDTKWP